MAKESVEADLKKNPSTSTTENSSKSFYKKSSKRQESNTLPSKVLVRRLPPAMTKECFLEEVSPLPDHNYLWFVEADKSLGMYAFSRAYINFVNQEDIFIFTEKFDGYIFVDKKGDEYSAIVEFAPFQKIPKAARKKDAKNATIETDPDYLKFVENLEHMLANKTPAATTAETLEEITSKERELKANKGVLKMSTPLLDFLRKKKEDKMRFREEKKEERRKKDADRRKQRDDDRKKPKDHKRPGEKPSKPDKPTKVLAGKHSVEKKPSEDELSSNLMTILKITEITKEQGEASGEVHVPPPPPPPPKKTYPHKEGKAEPKEIKKREFKRKERKAAPASSAAGEEKAPKADFHHEKKAPPKPKPAHPPKEPKSYKEERQKIQEARAARAAAKLESKSEAAEKGEAAGGEESKSSKTAQRVRNKDRPALQIYRPGMLKRSTSDSKDDDDSKGKADE